ncbi:hypothetical protein MKW92_011514, partial [Papaver armeniacum]
MKEKIFMMPIFIFMRPGNWESLHMPKWPEHTQRIVDETLRDSAQACPNLHFLNASYCHNISLE